MAGRKRTAFLLQNCWDSVCYRSKYQTWMTSVAFVGLIACCTCSSAKVDVGSVNEIRNAHINVSYVNPKNGQVKLDVNITGRYGVNSTLQPVTGQVVHVRGTYGANHGCTPIRNVPTHGLPWIALIRRGSCKFTHKINNAAVRSNASAVVVYDHGNDGHVTMVHEQVSVVVVFIKRVDGEKIANWTDAGARVSMNISLAHVTVFTVEKGGIQMKNPMLIALSLTIVAVLSIAVVAVLLYTIRRSKIRDTRNRCSVVYLREDGTHVQQGLLVPNGSREESPDSANRWQH